MLRGYIVDHLQYQHGLAYARTAEKPYLSAADIRRQKIDYLNARFQYLGAEHLLVIPWRRAMNGPPLSLNGAAPVHRLSYNIYGAPQRALAHRHLYGLSRGKGRHAAHQPLGGMQRYAPYRALRQQKRALQPHRALLLRAGHIYGLVDTRNTAFKHRVHHRSYNRCYLSLYFH